MVRFTGAVAHEHNDRKRLWGMLWTRVEEVEMSRSVSKQFALVGVAATAAGLMGCGAAATSNKALGAQAVVEFPGRDSLAAIAGKPMPRMEMPKTAPAMDEWNSQQVSQANEASGVWQATNDWDKMFVSVVDAMPKKPRLTNAMACVAREMGQFYLEHDAPPDQSLERFMIASCGNLVPDITTGYVTLEVPEATTDADIYTNAGPKFRPLVEKDVPAASDLAGFWFGRRGKKIAAFVVSAQESATITSFSPTPNDQGEILIEGRNERAQYFRGYINQGSSKAVPCDVDISVRAPAFRVVCHMDSQDEMAWVQLIAIPPKRALGTVFAQTLVRRSVDAKPRYVAIKYGDAAPVKTAQEFTSKVIVSLNRARETAGLTKVSLAKAQSATAATVASHYFASAFGAEAPQQADLIALGLLAGWDVGGMIRSANFISNSAATLDVNRWLSMALEMPIGRNTLFAPDIEQVAFGPAIMASEGHSNAVAVGYRFHHDKDHATDEEALFSRVMQSRKRMGMSPPTRIANFAPILDQELVKVQQGVASLEDATNMAMKRCVESTQMGVSGFVVQAGSLDELQIPDKVLRQKTLRMDIGVTHFKAPGAAWAQYAVVVLFAMDTGATDDSERVAMISSAP